MKFIIFAAAALVIQVVGQPMMIPPSIKQHMLMQVQTALTPLAQTLGSPYMTMDESFQNILKRAIASLSRFSQNPDHTEITRARAKAAGELIGQYFMRLHMLSKPSRFFLVDRYEEYFLNTAVVETYSMMAQGKTAAKAIDEEWALMKDRIAKFLVEEKKYSRTLLDSIRFDRLKSAVQQLEEYAINASKQPTDPIEVFNLLASEYESIISRFENRLNQLEAQMKKQYYHVHL